MMKYLPAVTYGFGGSYFITTQNDYLKLIGFQVVTVLLLANMSFNKNSPWGVKAWTVILGASLVARLISLAINKLSPINKAAKYRRWDALATMIGYSVTTGYLIKTLIPGKAIRKYVGLVTCGIPSVVAMAMATFTKHEDDLLEYAQYSSDVYTMYTIRDAATDTRVSIHDFGDALVIAFAGTDSTKNILTDLRVTDRAFPACALQKTRVHAGFLKAWNAVRDQVFDVVKGKTKVTCTGHSLGGALAMLAGLDIACSLENIKDISVITFGAPAVGDELFVDSFSQKITRSVRVVNPLDPVPRGLTSQFTHVKGLYFVPSTKINPHDMSSYQKAVGYSVGWKVVSLILPIVYISIIVLIFFKLKRGIFKKK